MNAKKINDWIELSNKFETWTEEKQERYLSKAKNQIEGEFEDLKTKLTTKGYKFKDPQIAQLELNRFKEVMPHCTLTNKIVKMLEERVIEKHIEVLLNDYDLAF